MSRNQEIGCGQTGVHEVHDMPGASGVVCGGTVPPTELRPHRGVVDVRVANWSMEVGFGLTPEERSGEEDVRELYASFAATAIMLHSARRRVAYIGAGRRNRLETIFK